MWQRVSLLALTAALAGLAAGCGESGPKRYRVSGSVTFDGKPVPAGMVVFTPDATKGNTGPQGKAVIRNGTYDTDADGGLGTVGGPMTVAVEGFDPNAKVETDKSGEVVTRPLFPRYETTINLPKASTTKDIAVPAVAAGRPAAKGKVSADP